MVDVANGLGVSVVTGPDTFADTLADTLLDGSLDDAALGEIEEAFTTAKLEVLARGIGYLRRSEFADRKKFKEELRRLVKLRESNVRRALSSRFGTSAQAGAGIREQLLAGRRSRGVAVTAEVFRLAGANDIAVEPSRTPLPRPAVLATADVRMLHRYTDATEFARTIVDLDSEALGAAEGIFRQDGLKELASAVSELKRGRENGISLSKLEGLYRRLMQLALADVSQVRKTFEKLPTGGKGNPLFVSAGRRASATSLRNDEELLAGAEWRKTVLPEVLGQIGHVSAVPVEKAFHILSNPKMTAATKVVALRILGDHLRGLDTVDRFLTALELISGILEQPLVDSMLREMASTLLHQINRPPTDVLISDFSLRSFFDGAIKGDSHVWMINGKSAPQTDLTANLERIRRLKARVFPLLGLPRPKPLAGWESRWPAWYSVIPYLFGERTSYFMINPEEIFWDSNLYPWQRALALAYYSYRIHFDSRFSPNREDMLVFLLGMIRNPEEDTVVKEMAIHVYEKIVLNEMASIPIRENGSLLTALWKIDRAMDHFQAAVGPSHPVVARLKREIERFRRDLVPNVERRWRPGWHPRSWFNPSTRRVGVQ